MDALNLPAFDYKLKRTTHKYYIFDILRKKYVCLTPEEWVRQHMVHYLIDHLAYPRSLIKLECTLLYGHLPKRVDIIVYDTKGNPLLIIECKAASESICTTMLEQAACYRQVFKAPFVIITNGLEHVSYKVEKEKATCTLLKKIPFFEELLHEL